VGPEFAYFNHWIRVQVTRCYQTETLREVVTWECGFFKYKARVHKSVVDQQAIRHCEFVQLNHPDYSPDLGPSDYSVFRKLKFRLCETQFADAESKKVAVAAWFDRQGKKILIFFRGINSVDET